jgi:hypothetical protein
MQRDIIIADGFYADPAAVVRHAMSMDYVQPYRETDFEKKTGVPPWRTSRWQPAASCPFKSSETLIRKLEHLTGETLDREHWALDFPLDNQGLPVEGFRGIPRSCWWNCSFHVKHYNLQQIGQGIHNHTASDVWNCVGPDGWVGLIYLSASAPREAGLRTWHNRDPAHEFDWMTGPENWNLVDSFANEYNRLILHRGRLPHSGSAGWGNTIENGRLYQTFFFRSLAVAGAAPVALDELGMSHA